MLYYLFFKFFTNKIGYIKLLVIYYLYLFIFVNYFFTQQKSCYTQLLVICNLSTAKAIV